MIASISELAQYTDTMHAVFDSLNLLNRSASAEEWQNRGEPERLQFRKRKEKSGGMELFNYVIDA